MIFLFHKNYFNTFIYIVIYDSIIFIPNTFHPTLIATTRMEFHRKNLIQLREKKEKKTSCPDVANQKYQLIKNLLSYSNYIKYI